MYTSIQTYVYACIHTYIHTTYIHTYIHTNIHTHAYREIEREREREREREFEEIFRKVMLFLWRIAMSTPSWPHHPGIALAGNGNSTRANVSNEGKQINYSCFN